MEEDSPKQEEKVTQTLVYIAIDAAKDNIQKITSEAKKAGREYTKTINEHQNQIGKITQEGIMNYYDYYADQTKDTIDLIMKLSENSPYLNPAITNSYLYGVSRIANTYREMVNNFTQNFSAFSRIANNVTSTNQHIYDLSTIQLTYSLRQLVSIGANNVNIFKDLQENSIGQATITEDTKNVNKIQRYLYVTFPSQVKFGDTVYLRSEIKANDSKPIISNRKIIQAITEIELDVPPGKEEVYVLLHFNEEDSDFHIDEGGKKYQKISVPAADYDCKPTVFSLKAKRKGFSEIRLEVFEEAVYIGELKINPLVIEPDPIEPEGKIVMPQLTSFDLVKTHTFPIKSLPPSPDVTLIILQTKDKPNAEYEVLYYSVEEGHAPVGSIRLLEDSKSKFDAIFNDIEKTNLSPYRIDDKIKSIGQVLYDEIFTEKLKERYWNARDNRRISSIWIESMEPWIPWEIVKPWRKLANGQRVEDDFLCQSFSFSRWLVGRAPITKEQIRKIRIIVPYDTKLENAKKEREWIKQFARDHEVQCSEASSYKEVMDFTLRSGNFDILHFSTHGKYNKDSPLLSSIILEDGDEIRPEDIYGLATTFGDSHPIVILNACQSGIQDFSFTGIQSWAKRFLEAGASAFICTLWSVKDETAFNFTKELYTQLSSGVSLGDAVKTARLNCRKDGDPSWLAYQLFGHPNMKIRFGNR